MNKEIFTSLRIEKLVAGGNGLARTPEGVVLVENAAPGELLDAECICKKGDTPIAAAVTIHEPSADRRIPPCPLAGTCGGCDWQHLQYDAQLAAKERIFRESLRRIAKLEPDMPIELFKSHEWRYRSRAQVKIDRDAAIMGFYRRRTNQVIRVSHCPLLVDPLNEILGDQEAILAMAPQNAKELRMIAGDANRVASSPAISGFTYPETIISIGDITYAVPGNAFFQGNAHLLQPLGQWAAGIIGGNFFIDLFGGLGFFALMLGRAFSAGLLIEEQRRQVMQAQRNFRMNTMKRLRAMAVRAEEFFKSKTDCFPRPDCIILDPPRPGLTRKVRQGVRDMAPETILSISCNPVTHARDLGFLTANGVYEITKMALFDLYPQTHHMETAAILRRTA